MRTAEATPVEVDELLQLTQPRRGPMCWTCAAAPADTDYDDTARRQVAVARKTRRNP